MTNFLTTNSFAAELSPENRNPLSLRQSLELAGQNMLDVLDSEDRYLPYWQLSVSSDYTAQFKKWWPAHNLDDGSTRC